MGRDVGRECRGVNNEVYCNTRNEEVDTKRPFLWVPVISVALVATCEEIQQIIF